MKKRLLLLLVSFSAFSQAPTIQWDKTLGGSANERLTAIKQIPDGGFIAVGYSNSPVSGEKSQESRGYDDYWIVRTDSGGELVWEKTFGGSGPDYATDVIHTDDGGFLIGGYSGSDISGDKTEATRGTTDYWIVKLDPDGNLEWQKAYGGNLGESLGRLIKTGDGYLLCGGSNSVISGDKTTEQRGNGDIWLVKINLGGDIQWQRSYGGTLNEFSAYGSATADSGFIIGCKSLSTNSGDRTIPRIGTSDAWIIKLDANGNEQWQSAFPMSDFKSVRQTTDGGYIVAGSDFGLMGRGEQSFQFMSNLFKIDSDGQQLWEFRLQPIYGECDASDIFEEADGSFIMATTSSGGGTYSCLSKVSPLGSLVWNRNLIAL